MTELRPLDWRRDPHRRAALRALPRSKVFELACIIERGPGFACETRRQDFPCSIRSLAAMELRRLAELPPSTTELKKALQQFDRAARQLEKAFAELPEDGRWTLLDHLVPYPDLPDPLMEQIARQYLTREPDGLNVEARGFVINLWRHRRTLRLLARMERELPELAKAAQLAAESVRTQRGRRPSPHRSTIVHLVFEWDIATETRASVTRDPHSSNRAGPFYTFVLEFLTALNLNTGRLTALVEDITRKMRRQSGH